MPISRIAGSVGYADENEDPNERSNPVSRIDDDERAHYRSDRTARAETGDARTGAARDLSEHRDYAAQQIEDDVAKAAHRVFDRRAKGPEKNHVADDVHPARVHKHGGHDGDQVRDRAQCAGE